MKPYDLLLLLVLSFAVLIGLIYILSPAKLIEIQYKLLLRSQAKSSRLYLLFFLPNVMNDIEDESKWKAEAKDDYMKYGICLVAGGILGCTFIFVFH